ncbi:hypothetical protein HDU87_002012 [Geranomyces variabilis]|uniref:Uncharacterized protein n=1 Tax=Geranomyces variabilis TaxID=109894 RepID=A0AAD5XRN3_9FUNG|nr:hypothetical protein HDU87_002012 [Geranomyces variabilis]
MLTPNGYGVSKSGPRVEGATTGFSLPLIIAREGSMIRLGSYTVSTYDFDYDPLIELDTSILGGEQWRLVSLYRFHAGTVEFAAESTDEIEDTLRVEAEAFADDWVRALEDRGYADTRQAIAVILSGERVTMEDKQMDAEEEPLVRSKL